MKKHPKRPKRSAARALVVVVVCITAIFANVRIASATKYTGCVLEAREEFSIGCEIKPYLNNIVVLTPPAKHRKSVAARLYEAPAPKAPTTERKSGLVKKCYYILTVEITLKEGHTFSGESDPPLSVESYVYPFELTQMDTDRNRYVKFTFTADLTDDYAVRFYLNDGSPRFFTRGVAPGCQIRPPEIPQRAGYKFNGWWTDPKKGQMFNFSKPVKADTVLYAHWTPLPAEPAATTKPTTKPPTKTTTTTTTITTATAATTTTTPSETTTGTTTEPPDTTTEDTTTEWETSVTEEMTTEPSTSVPADILTTNRPMTPLAVISKTAPDKPEANSGSVLFRILLIILAPILVGGAIGYLIYTIKQKKMRGK